MTSPDGHPKELLNVMHKNTTQNPGIPWHFPVQTSGLRWGGVRVGTYTGSVGGSMVHLEAHFEIRNFLMGFSSAPIFTGGEFSVLALVARHAG